MDSFGNELFNINNITLFLTMKVLKNVANEAEITVH